MELYYFAQPPKKFTFEQPRLKEWVEKYCIGRVLNLFAGKVQLGVEWEVRVDVDRTMSAHYYMDAREFVNTWKFRKFDTVILDPPYTYRKSKEKYNGNYMGQLPRLKNELLGILNPGARIISLGWDTVGMGRSRGFEKIAACIVCHNGDHRDTLGLVEERILD